MIIYFCPECHHPISEDNLHGGDPACTACRQRTDTTDLLSFDSKKTDGLKNLDLFIESVKEEDVKEKFNYLPCYTDWDHLTLPKRFKRIPSKISLDNLELELTPKAPYPVKSVAIQFLLSLGIPGGLVTTGILVFTSQLQVNSSLILALTTFCALVFLMMLAADIITLKMIYQDHHKKCWISADRTELKIEYDYSRKGNCTVFPRIPLKTYAHTRSNPFNRGKRHFVTVEDREKKIMIARGLSLEETTEIERFINTIINADI